MTDKVIAIDFDGTITEDAPYPICGKVRDEAKQYIPILYALGYRLVLWTARKGKFYDECLQVLDDSNLLCYFSSEYETGQTGKIVAHFYIDDKSLLEPINWDKIFKYIIENV